MALKPVKASKEAWAFLHTLKIAREDRSVTETIDHVIEKYKSCNFSEETKK